MYINNMKNNKDSLGDRMKGYESVSQMSLMRRNPIIIRIDGKAFHTFTRGMDRPFDIRLADCMAQTTQSLVKNISGCYFGYTQSDEISLLLVDYMNIATEAWFDNKLQKIVSVAASMATLYFNKAFGDSDKLAMFDARAFSLPREEVVNYFLWRQNDCTRNSVQMVGRAHFSHKQLQCICNQNIQDKLFKEKGINWNDTPTRFKRGTAVYKDTAFIEKGSWDNGKPNKDIERTIMLIDHEIPIFSQDRSFIQAWVDIDKGMRPTMANKLYEKTNLIETVTDK
jgi:tRNA(His) guanylyltransferase